MGLNRPSPRIVNGLGHHTQHSPYHMIIYIMITMRMQLTCIVIIISLLFAPFANSLRTLSTQSRWIIDAGSAQRVKLRCGNWVGHMEPMIPEGLDKQPIDNIAAKMASLGFNCVRLTWAIYMYTRSSQLRVEDSLVSLSLFAARDGIRRNNPNILGMTVVDAQAAVVEALGNHGIMVILDNHVSKPQWCCSNDDGNGWFGDWFFDTNEWLNGLNLVATRYRGNRKVVGMSLRNELRGPHQDLQVWHNYMQQGANTVHNANPDLLVIVSGISYDCDLWFLRNPALRINVPNKLVYEVHAYAWTTGAQSWINDPLNQVCARFNKGFDDSAGFLINSGRDSTPLLVSEFGVDQRGINEADNRFLPCILSHLAEMDIDWALWAFHGSYYVRSGVVGMEEMYGLMDGAWTNIRNRRFPWIFQLPLTTVQDPQSKSAWHHVLYHPLTGNCVHIGRYGKITTGNCNGRTRWAYDARDGRIRVLGQSNQCLKVVSEGQPITISNDCSSPLSNWSILSDSKLHIGAKDGQGTQLCLAEGQAHTVYSSRCICVDGNNENCRDDPRSQWFKMVPSNV